MAYRLSIVAIYLLSFIGIAIAAPVVHKTGNVMFMSGGVGQESVDELASNAAGYSVKIVSAFKSGSYTGPFTVNITNKKGEQVLSNVTTDGPLLYVALPPGGYSFDVSLNGWQQSQSGLIRSNGRLQTLNFLWDEQKPVSQP